MIPTRPFLRDHFCFQKLLSNSFESPLKNFSILFFHKKVAGNIHQKVCSKYSSDFFFKTKKSTRMHPEITSQTAEEITKSFSQIVPDFFINVYQANSTHSSPRIFIQTFLQGFLQSFFFQKFSEFHRAYPRPRIHLKSVYLQGFFFKLFKNSLRISS